MGFLGLFKHTNASVGMLSKSDIESVKIAGNAILGQHDTSSQYVKELFSTAFDFYKKEKISEYEFFNATALLYCLGATIISPIMSDDDWLDFNEKVKEVQQVSLSNLYVERINGMTYYKIGLLLQNRVSILYEAAAQAFNTSSIGYVGAVFGTIWANDNHHSELTLFDTNSPMNYLTTSILKKYANSSCELCESIAPEMSKICNKVLTSYGYRNIIP